MKTVKTPKTWNELLDAGYVIELDECQIAEAKAKLNPHDAPRFVDYSERDKYGDDTNEKKMRGLK